MAPGHARAGASLQIVRNGLQACRGGDGDGMVVLDARVGIGSKRPLHGLCNGRLEAPRRVGGGAGGVAGMDAELAL